MFVPMRRAALKSLAASTAFLAVPQALAFPKRPKRARLASDATIAIVGGGFAGAGAARALKRLAPGLKIVLVEYHSLYLPPPAINTSLAGLRSMRDVAQDYQTFKQFGVKVIHDWVSAIDTFGKNLRLSSGQRLSYDRLIVATGTDFVWDDFAGLGPEASMEVPHAWKAGEQALILTKQLREMKNGGTVAVHASTNNQRCPNLIYERVGLIAHYLVERKARSKVLFITDQAIEELPAQIREYWAEFYGFGTENSVIEWFLVSADDVARVEATGRRLLAGDDHLIAAADVLNLIPAERGGRLAIAAGLADETGWCPVHPVTQESEFVDEIYVVGDGGRSSVFLKTADAALVQAELCALAIANDVEKIRGRLAQEEITHSCLNIFDDNQALLTSSKYRFHRKKGYRHVPQKMTTRVQQIETGEAFSWLDEINKSAWG